jgi:hypothetical protein
MALSYLTASATQGSADAFVQAEMATALSGIGNVAYRVREVLFEFSSIINGVSSDIAACIARRSKAAMPNVTDRDVLVKIWMQVKFTTSGAQNQHQVQRLTFTEDDELLVVEDPLYLVVDSASTALSNVVYARIGYERVSISALDRLSLLTQSLE